MIHVKQTLAVTIVIIQSLLTHPKDTFIINVMNNVLYKIISLEETYAEVHQTVSQQEIRETQNRIM